MKEKVVIGLSGGVDSSVAAYLLKKEGYEVIGTTMQTLDVGVDEDAKRVADTLGIEYRIVDFRKEFKAGVIDYFAKEYMEGRTPNPCVVCNRLVKWEALMRAADMYGADYVATGHYARVVRGTNGRYAVAAAESSAKDQTYALYNLTQEQLARTLMPVGAYSKDEIRSMAEQIGLNVAGKPDSMETCFVPDDDYGRFIRDNYDYSDAPGNFVDTQGKVLGAHKGIIHYTIGQRKGLGIALGKPAFVTKIDKDTNEVVLGENEDLMSVTVRAKDINYMSESSFDPGKEYIAKIRYNHKGAPCRISVNEEGILTATFEEKQRAATPGQALVIYDNGMVAGGGIII